MPFVYKISSPSTDKVYIGSTKLLLSTRFKAHIANGDCSSKQIIDLDDAVIELIEEVNVDNMKQRERFYIELMREKCINQVIPLRTKKEWHIEHKKEQNERTKIWCEKNKDYMKEKDIIRSVVNECECGGRFSLKSKSKHSKTKKHLDYLGKIQ